MVTSRKDCFFGLHFDFHAMPGDEVGSIIDIASIEEMLDATKPDMIQVDTKGHPGISSYMTAVGTHAELMARKGHYHALFTRQYEDRATALALDGRK